ncbi:MAG: PIN domain-containing protein [Chloroflexi bacterium]|nr:PIN domain-containing protein [Chloroflexota bacterium]
MPVAIDTSVLISAEKQENFDALLPQGEEGPYYIPALAASEFLVGTQPPVRADLRHRASQLYQSRFRALVSSFTEADAAHLAALISELKSKGQQMKFFDAGIAATVLARGDKLLVLDSDFDRLKDRIKLLRPSENRER